MRLGRLYVFFEKEVVRAVQTRSQMGDRSQEEWEQKTGDIQTTKTEARAWEVEWRRKPPEGWEDPVTTTGYSLID
jgi:hypothetical protein